MRVLHIITSLALGGAESVLLRLVERTSSECEVIGLQPNGVIGEAIERLGVPVRSLEMRSRVPSIGAIRKLARWSRDFRPDVVQTWLPAADLAGVVAGRAARAPVIWNVRNTMIADRDVPRGNRAVLRLAAATARFIPRRIVYGSHAAARAHEAAGYPSEKTVIIPNGVDVERFRPNGNRGDSIVIGLVARFDPRKDHRNFLDAAAQVARRRGDVTFVLAGEGLTADNATLISWLRERDLVERTQLVGRRMDIEQVTASFDIAALSSYTEGFPNVVAEAMACAVPVVATDVGDAGEIIGETGIVVPPRDPVVLAEGFLRLIEAGAEKRHELGAKARARIEEHYSLDVMVARYDALHAEVARR